MHQSRSLSAPSDVTRVDTNHSGDMRYWTRNLGVSEENLRAAVAHVGVLSSDVRAELRRKRLVDDTLRVVRIFVFYPSANHPDFWVLLPGAGQRTFLSEGAAVEFALGYAKSLRGSGRAVEVVQEKITGTWMRMHD
jgi:hypothetical protein